jgi:hypothetical protein
MSNKTFIAPVLGAATATSINGNTFTTGTYTLTGTAAKTLTFTNTLTLSGTDATVMTFPTTSATIARTDALNAFTGASTTTSWAMTTQVVTGGLTASGSGANTFAGSTGTFLTSTGAVTIGPGTVSITGVTTFTAASISTPVTLTDAATVATNAALGNRFRVTLAGNRTLGNPTNPADGQQCVWEIIQDATGTRTLAFDTQFAFGTDITTAVVSTGANKRDFLTAIYNSTATKWYVVGFVKGYS